MAKSQVLKLPNRELELALNGLLNTPDGDQRPVLLFLAGPNGSGKSSLFAELDNLTPGRKFPFVNADVLAKVVNGFPAADVLSQGVADLMRKHLVQQSASFATETVFSDEVGAKLEYLREAAKQGFRVVLIYVVLANVALSRQRVQFRVKEDHGHDVPAEKLQRRFIASKENCRRALNWVEHGLVIDNSSVNQPLQLRAITHKGATVYESPILPAYIRELLPIPSANSEQRDSTQHRRNIQTKTPKS